MNYVNDLILLLGQDSCLNNDFAVIDMEYNIDITQSTNCFPIEICDDRRIEDTESFTVNFMISITSSQVAYISIISTAIVTINDQSCELKLLSFYQSLYYSLTL